jgi:DNA-binding XRE family transcriptional regulator
MCDEISQTDFAKKLGVSKAHLCDIEKGRRTDLSSLQYRRVLIRTICLLK